MKPFILRLLKTLLLMTLYNNAYAGQTDHFVITVDTSIAGSTGANFFTIPTTGSGYNYSIDGNNDGVFDFINETGNKVINFATPGIKTIRIFGDFPRIYFNDSGDKDKILSVEQWGSNQWSSMNNAFSGASNLVINATDQPDLSNVLTLFRMFADASNVGNGTGNWDWNTSNITGMSQTFRNASSFDQNISSWNIENVTNVGAMFTGVTLSDENYDALLIAWAQQNIQNNLLFNGGDSQYCSSAAVNAREQLTSVNMWTISDGGRNPECENDIDLSLQLSSNRDFPNSGDLVDFVIEVTNSGDIDAINSILTDTLPLPAHGNAPPLTLLNVLPLDQAH